MRNYPNHGEAQAHDRKGFYYRFIQGSIRIDRSITNRNL